MDQDVVDPSEEPRTVVVSGVPDVLPCSRMADKLEIHFQSSRSHGGDVDRIRYPTNIRGVAFVTFEDVRDVDKVLETDQIMEDKEFPEAYTLTVFKFSDDVFFFARGEADLSLFGDYERLVRALRASHRSVRIVSLLPSEGRVLVEGPFRAVRELREDLSTRAQTEQAQSKRAQTQRDQCGWLREDLSKRAQTEQAQSKRAQTEQAQSKGSQTQRDQCGQLREAQSKRAQTEQAQSKRAQTQSDQCGQLREAQSKRAQTQGDQCGRSSPGDVAEAGPAGASEEGASYDQESRTWVDTSVFKYIQRFYREDFDLCLSRYFVEASCEEMGDLTQITLKAKGPSSSVRGAKSELEVSVTTRQSALRSHRIAYGTADEERRRALESLCGDLNVYPDVLLIPLASCIEVIGPSLAGHLLCESVEKRRALRDGRSGAASVTALSAEEEEEEREGEGEEEEEEAAARCLFCPLQGPVGITLHSMCGNMAAMADLTWPSARTQSLWHVMHTYVLQGIVFCPHVSPARKSLL
ncbi:hypothetical protein AAFF_G00056610 [Aldrovandia affinis]|uniref:RRM domain-containing protein n=1 Tax=Aldrovandia affinis TaxID=143900 RepID=A0AAD7WE41_9TELE|nr:hypothetical protein AAFF_G00056610 [Aldrovandia affinis]